MDRGALLLYLRNVRDLEVAKYRINVQYNREKQRVEKKKRELATAHYKEDPSKVENPAGRIVLTVCSFIFGFGILVASLFTSTSSALEFAYCGIGLFFISIGLMAVINLPKVVPAWNHYMEACDAVKKYNAEEDERLQNNKPVIARLTTDWKNKERWYNGERSKVQQLLADFYGMNILANQYRNLAAVCYIYDYMSSSQASLEDTLIHEHMENGIQRLEAKLDSIIVRLEDIVYETRCLRRNSERTIEQNNNMLTSLQQTERNTMEAAQYAQLSANYSRANAYFSLATYLKD